ncbi:MAG: FG-GAP repeat protein [Candidatus Kerfeldbacteria bacterium]|nr:FG-GAP repeat protein [Candidatus Kerfeldbacteria bacterium]
MDGQATALANAAIATTADVTFTGEAGSDLLGYGLVGANLNGDSYPELVTSAPYNDSGANASGTVYVGYLRIDADGDGTLSSAGILEQGTDCNDDDATVVADQTYYLDEDGDDLGVDTETTVLCSSTAPTGYADNTDDTNDEIKNNGIEIIGDEVDNDGDGEVDETNTKAENGSHPEYGSDDPTDADAVAAAIVSVKAKKQGKVRVRYADDSVYVYTIFGRPGSRKPSLKQYPNSGYYGVLDKAGKKIALLNVLNGKVVDTTPIDGKGFRKHFLQFTDLRDDGTMDVVITSKHRSSTIVRVAIAAVRVSHHRRIRLYATQTIDAPQTVLRNTTIVGNTIDIRDTQTAIVSLLVTKQHKLKQL